MQRYIFLVLFLGLVAFGCSKGNQVTGTVKLADGSPLTLGTVHFQTDSFLATGKINSDGTYSIVASPDGKGIPNGSYQVYVTGTEGFELPPDSADPTDGTVIPSPIAAKYASRTESGLTCDVNGATVCDMTLDAP